MGTFDVAIAMHACGNASDYAQAAAIRCGASYVMAPCCVGKLKQSTSVDDSSEGAAPVGGALDESRSLTHPRSKAMRLSCTHQEFLELASFADHEAAASSGAVGSLCKSLVEHDRASYARERGWTALAGRMEPESCSAKCDVLVGLTPSRAHLEPRLRANAAATAAAVAAAALCEECVPDPSAATATAATSATTATVATAAAKQQTAPPKPPKPPKKRAAESQPCPEQPAAPHGTCGFFIARRQRNCRQPAVDVNGMCVAHCNTEAREATAQQDRARRIGALRIGQTLESLSVAACIGLLVEVKGGRLGLVVAGDANKDLVVQLSDGCEDGESDGESGGEGGGGEGGGGGGSREATDPTVVCVARSAALLAREVAWTAPASSHERTREKGGRGGPPNPLALHNLRADVTDESLDAACALLGRGRQLHVDLSCGDGRYVLQAAAAAVAAEEEEEEAAQAVAPLSTAWLGLDFHEPSILVATNAAAEQAGQRVSAQQGAAQHSSRHGACAAFLCANCHQLASLGRLLDRLSDRGMSLGSASVILPTQWPKARHAQRRLLSAALLSLLHARLSAGGRLLVACTEGAAADEAERLIMQQGQWSAAPPASSFPPSCVAATEQGGGVGVRVMRFERAEPMSRPPMLSTARCV